MRRKALHTIMMALFLAAAVCGGWSGSLLPVPLSANATLQAGTPMPMPTDPHPPNATLQAGVYPGTPMPMPTDPHPPNELLIS